MVTCRTGDDALGFFLMNHPLLPYRREVRRLHLAPLDECRDMPPDSVFKSAVLVTSIRNLYDKKSRRWGLLQVEDLTASGTAFCFSSLYAECAELLEADMPLYIEGRISKDRDGDQMDYNGEEEPAKKDVKFILEKVQPLAEVCALSTEPVTININAGDNPSDTLPNKLEQLKSVLAKHSGDVPVHALVQCGESWCLLALGPRYTVQPSPVLDHDISVWNS